MVEPGIDGAKRFGIELVNAVAAFPVLPHQVGTAQQAQMLGNGGTGNGESLGDFPGRLAAAAQKIENGAAGWIGERLECCLGRICNRTVTHNA